VKLSEEGLAALAVAADSNGNNRIEYEEYMSHFKTMIKILKTQLVLNASGPALSPGTTARSLNESNA
jgi:hypothetical protein